MARIVVARVLLCFVFALVTVDSVKAAPMSAEDYVQSNVATGLSILQDKTLSQTDRRARVRDFLLSLLDTKRIAIYALDSAGAAASPADLAAYTDAFRDFMAANYASQLNGYGGQTLRITGTVQRNPSDFIVRAALVDPSASPADTPQEVDIRVADEDGAFHVVDASIGGIWLAVAEHDDFQGFLKAHNNDVAALTAHLKEMTAKFLAGPATN